MTSAALADGFCLLFVYGLLQPEFQPPTTWRRAWRDRVHGLLADLGPYPALVQLDRTDTWVAGQVLEIAASELSTLDEFEDLADGLYQRCRTTTEQGFQVWIYEYLQPLPEPTYYIPYWPYLK